MIMQDHSEKDEKMVHCDNGTAMTKHCDNSRKLMCSELTTKEARPQKSGFQNSESSPVSLSVCVLQNWPKLVEQDSATREEVQNLYFV